MKTPVDKPMFKVGDRLTNQGATVTVLTVHPIGCPLLKKEHGQVFAEHIYEVKSDFSNDKPGSGWLVPQKFLKFCTVKRKKKGIKTSTKEVS